MKAYFASNIITEKGLVKDAYLLENDGKIIGIEEELDNSIPVVSYPGCYLSPGFIDIHTHGALGYETGYGEIKDLLRWSNFNLENGVTGFLPSTASIPLKRVKKVVEDIREVRKRDNMNILGLQMEGPFYVRGPKIGAQNPLYIVEDFPEEYRDFISDNNDVIRYIAVDPCHSAAKEIVPFCKDLGIKVSAAHSGILYKDFLPKKSYGFSCITHTFNGMNGLHHRTPGLAYAACMDQDLYAEIICDGFHVAYPMLELFFKLKGYDKSILVTDSILATGMAPGSYQLGGIEVTLNEEGKVYKADGGLAGSTLTMDKAVRNLVNNLDIAIEKVVKMASLNPAKLLGIDKSKGSLSDGKDADFIVLDDNLEVQATFIKGKNVFKKSY